MTDRPRIKVIPTPLDKTLEMIGNIMLVLLWLLTIYVWIKAPATIPVHFGIAGKADSYGSKATLLFVPAIATIVFFGLTLLMRYPHSFNYMVAITPTNAPVQYAGAIRLLRVVKLVVMVLCTVLLLFTYLAAIGVINGLGGWFLPFVLCTTLLPVVITVVWSAKKG